MNDDGRRTKRARLSIKTSAPYPALVDMNNLDAIIVTVEQFLSIEETINLSKTCRAIRNILVHNPNGAFPKIKVSHFEVADDDDEVDAALPLPPHRRIQNYTSNVLANIHFPTLERLVVQFPRGKVHLTGDWVDELRDSFIYLALGLERAVNLEELIVDFTPFLLERSDFLSQNNYNTLAANLCCCTKLKRLNIINRLDERQRGGDSSIYSLAFLAAFIPAIERGVSTLEGVSFVFGEDPVTLSPATISSSSSVDNNDNIIRQSTGLFRSILLCNKLKELSLIFSGRAVQHSSLSKSFLQVSRDIHSETEGNLPSSSMEKLTLKCLGREEGGRANKALLRSKSDGVSIAPFMDMISKQPNLDVSNVFVNDF
mmetsp:Transcript_5057/g.7347  ORF Transcript_5057/g.7347 Transcript_5057/m.7347 type:complete len:371 (-) Transcript_5057:230-1342(-)|eukprot:CAMPEP_0201690838 /NCGR_PEP_ID=MMETSP0578-20130828/4150_1 /ASSEMBLY_ACC=CAM_ASM_000663 /TAXON_ID=267565 /ORGANISM="Skeletonema grethea, Strain CCMP 1804" /LENGTH=370 /DNA_ID=CAMNT_0048175909 /DNA_START=88 /DNA_END=1200 /DNA_ORIENTATION=+